MAKKRHQNWRRPGENPAPKELPPQSIGAGAQPMSVEDPVSPAEAAAVLAHEMYTSYVYAGFSEDQALDLVKALMTTMAQNAGSDD